MTRVLAIHGALEIDNFGDVLLGRIFCDWAREAGWRVAAPSAEPRVAAQLGELVDANYEGADKLLYIGGGYLGEPPRSIYGKLRWGHRLIGMHLNATAAARRRNIPYAVIGAGAGPISNPLARWAVRGFLDQAEIVAVRDDESAAFIRRLRVKRSVEVTADAALSLYDAPLSEKAQTSRQALLDRASGRRILIMHVAKPGAHDRGYAKIYSAMSQTTLPEDVMVVSIADQQGTAGAEQQVAASDQVASIWPRAINLPYVDLDTLIGVIAAADQIVTTKLHVGIVGTALRRQVLAFPAHPKTSRFYRQTEQWNQCIPIGADTKDMAEALGRLLMSSPEQPAAVLQQVDKALANKRVMTTFLSE